MAGKCAKMPMMITLEPGWTFSTDDTNYVVGEVVRGKASMLAVPRSGKSYLFDRDAGNRVISLTTKPQEV